MIFFPFDVLTCVCFDILVPQVLKSCSEFIEKHGIVDGIYRHSGISSNIQKLRFVCHKWISGYWFLFYFDFFVYAHKQ